MWTVSLGVDGLGVDRIGVVINDSHDEESRRNRRNRRSAVMRVPFRTKSAQGMGRGYIRDPGSGEDKFQGSARPGPYPDMPTRTQPGNRVVAPEEGSWPTCPGKVRPGSEGGYRGYKGTCHQAIKTSL